METYIPRFFLPPKRSFFFFGPRGTGKSTFLRHHYPEALWIDLLKPDVFRTYAARPERLIDVVHGNPNKKIVIVDEVQMEGLVRNLGGFSRFLEAISFSHAGLLNVSSVARECEVERKVVEGYIKILEDILLGFKLPVFSKKAKRSLVSHAKFFFFDAGVFRALRPKGPLDQPEEIDGAALEGLVLQHLRAWNAYRGNPYELFYWRSRHGVEVDFVLYGETGIYAIEVKNAKRVREEDLTSLRAFQEDYPRGKTLLLYRGQERLLRKDILCLPCANFLKLLAPNKGLSALV